MSERRLPPIGELGIASMVLTIVSTIYLAAHIPDVPPLWPSIALLACAGVLLLVNAVALAGLRDFAWRTFSAVARWTLVAYVVIAGMLVYVFVYNDTPGRVLALLTVSLVLFAANVVLILAFGVARYQPA
jgi:hypothetical protein